MTLPCCAALLTCALNAAAATSERALPRYPGLPPGTTMQAITVDQASNLFVVAVVPQLSGRQVFRVLKFDAQENLVGSIDFGGQRTGLPDGDQVVAAAVDPTGALVLTGTAASMDFPLVSPLITIKGHSGFIIKFDSQLHTILFSTKLGGTLGQTDIEALAIDRAGNIYVGGGTYDNDFPVTAGAYETVPPNGYGEFAFLTEINPTGTSIVFSSYFGGKPSSPVTPGGSAIVNGIAFDSSGNIIIAGNTYGLALPTTYGVVSESCGDQCDTGFLAKFSSTGSKLIWSTFVPGVFQATAVGNVGITSMALDGNNNVIVGGTGSISLPVTKGALQTDFPGISSPYVGAGFVMKVDASAEHILYATYFGGLGGAIPEGVLGLAADSQGGAWVIGSSPTGTLPIPTSTPNLGENYVAHLSPDGSNVETAFTAPVGAANLAIVTIADDDVVVAGASGPLLTLSPGDGPSLIAITNAAQFSLAGAVAPRELISFFGLNLGPQSPANEQVLDGSVTTSLAGVQVVINGIPAPLLYAGATQVNAVVPDSLALQNIAAIQISSPSGTITVQNLPVELSQPGVFPAPGDRNFGQPPFAVAQNEDGTMNSPDNPASPGSVITVWATGVGPSSVGIDGQIIGNVVGVPLLPISVLATPSTPTATFGPTSPPEPHSLEVLSAQDTPGMIAGIIEVRFRLPEASQLQDNYSFSLQAGDATSDEFGINVSYPTEMTRQPRGRGRSSVASGISVNRPVEPDRRPRLQGLDIEVSNKF